MTDSIFELEQILRFHGKKYPQMEPADAVKLVYQNEFGGGHLITDEQKCLEFLRTEYDALPKDFRGERYEVIGNGLIRVHLRAVKAEKLEALGIAFLRSAAQHSGSYGTFLKKLEVLRRVTKTGCFGFDGEALEQYLTAYLQAGCPCLSHSQRYRAAYHPAYRVVEKY